MVTLTKILCRLWQCAAPGQGRDRSDAPNNTSSDDLTVIGKVKAVIVYRAEPRDKSRAILKC